MKLISRCGVDRSLRVPPRAAVLEEQARLVGKIIMLGSLKYVVPQIVYK
jgi:hypothetical protein